MLKKIICITLLLSIYCVSAYSGTDKISVTWDYDTPPQNLEGFDLRINENNSTLISIPGEDRSWTGDVEVVDGNNTIDMRAKAQPRQTTINQYENGGQWNVLGTYTFTGTAKITIVSTSSVDSTCADAVKFSQTSATEVIIDNGDPGTSYTGIWQNSSGLNPYGENSLYSKTPDTTYTFETNLNGVYEVSIWWTEKPSRSRNVPVKIYDDTAFSIWSIPCKYNPVPGVPTQLDISSN